MKTSDIKFLLFFAVLLLIITGCSAIGEIEEDTNITNSSDASSLANESSSSSVSPDNTAPIPSDLSITSSGIVKFAFSWNEAADDITSKENLQYKLVYSTALPKTVTVKQANEKWTTAMDWTKNVTSYTADNLICATKYCFALIVKDESGNISMYNLLRPMTKNFEYKIYFENDAPPYYLTNFAIKSDANEGWTALNIGTLTPKHIDANASVSAQFIIRKPNLYFSVKYRDYNQTMVVQHSDLQPGKIYKIKFYKQQISPFSLRSTVVEGLYEVGSY